MLLAILGILLLFWLIGLVTNVVGGLIHIVLVIVVVVFVARMLTSRRSA
ncbi:MAG TPA: lmo0937 family membrane protein [Candidatus Limnocylindrales bacterium]|nr:lmo0937 family membrane protein [Candidatus Limnocylindrales bacterium]